MMITMMMMIIIIISVIVKCFENLAEFRDLRATLTSKYMDFFK